MNRKSAPRVAEFVRLFFQGHPDGEVYFYFRSVTGRLDEIIATSKTHVTWLGEEFLVFQHEKDEDDMVRIRDIEELSEVNLATGEDEQSRSTMPESPMPDIPGAPEQVE